MNFTRHFFIEGRYLGKATQGLQWTKGGDRPVPPVGHFFFCSFCGRVWAECPVEGQNAHCWSVACAKHTPGEFIGGYGPARIGGNTVSSFTPPGSISLSWEPEFVAAFPPAVVKHELLAHLRWVALTAPAPVASSAHDLLQSLSR